MMTNRPTSPAPSGQKPAKRSLVGWLFMPQLGPTVSPLRDSTRMFLRLVANVFAIYGLFPKNHPALRDESRPLSFGEIVSTAWQNIEFTREGLPRAIMFFAVIGMMGFSAIMALFALLALLSSHAHAQSVDASAFSAEGTNDLAQSWLNYLFIYPSNGGGGSFLTASDTFGDATANMQDPFNGSSALQTALIKALAFYSEAILIVAAFILFYHLTAMIVETAHHGVPMGKRASQVWAPIRLVVAIGLLVPINGGLNCGQFIVIKMAELGSGFASHTWDQFLTTLENYNSRAVPPHAPMVEAAALDFIRMKACQLSWNYHVQEAINGGTNIATVEMADPTGTPTIEGNMPGTRYTYSSDSLADTDICGWYFIPADPSNALDAKAATIQASAISSSDAVFVNAANKMNDILAAEAANPGSAPNGGTTTPTLDTSFNDAAATYAQTVADQIQTLTGSQQSQMASALETLKPYGWVMAGATLNTIDRMQGGIVAAAADSAPITHAPKEGEIADSDRTGGFWHSLFGHNTDAAWDIRRMVGKDMAAFNGYMDTALRRGVRGSNATNNKDAQCAAMVGLDASGGGNNALVTAGANTLFGVIDYIASMNGVWNSGKGTSCGTSTNSNTTFTLGIQFNGTDPFAQMAYLGHSNLNVAMNLIALNMGASIGGGLMKMGAGIPVIGNVLGGLGSLISGAAGLLSFMALVFFACGFTLAYLVPLMPFFRFFFSVLSWVGAIIEAIVAVPLVALAHLNPEGEGLPGGAKNAYAFIFNLALRPVLMIFGFICGYIVFLIALSFLNYAYAIAVAGAGGTAYGHAAMSRITYSVLYVAVVYVCANHSFMLIDHLPSHAMQWMGASGQAFPQMGDTGAIEKVAGVVSTIGGQQVMGQLNGIGAGIGGFLGKPKPSPSTPTPQPSPQPEPKSGSALNQFLPSVSEKHPTVQLDKNTYRSPDYVHGRVADNTSSLDSQSKQPDELEDKSLNLSSGKMDVTSNYNRMIPETEGGAKGGQNKPKEDPSPTMTTGKASASYTYNTNNSLIPKYENDFKTNNSKPDDKSSGPTEKA